MWQKSDSRSLVRVIRQLGDFVTAHKARWSVIGDKAKRAGRPVKKAEKATERRLPAASR